jgi:hypothetical protein
MMKIGSHAVQTEAPTTRDQGGACEMIQQPENEQPGELFYCPCCGYRGLHGPAYSEISSPPFGDPGDPPYIGRFGHASFECCDSCGLEFGYDDDPGASGRACSFKQYRTEFDQRGQTWFRPAKRPEGWTLEEQLIQAGIL